MYENVHCVNCRWHRIMKVENKTDINDMKCPHCGLKELYLGELIIQS